VFKNLALYECSVTIKQQFTWQYYRRNRPNFDSLSVKEERSVSNFVPYSDAGGAGLQSPLLRQQVSSDSNRTA